MAQKPLSELLREAAADTPQFVIAARSGVSTDQVSKILSGDTKDPRWSTIVPLIREGLKKSLDAFAGGDLKPELTPYDKHHDIRECVDALVALDVHDRRRVLEFMEWLAVSLARRGGEQPPGTSKGDAPWRHHPRP